MEQFEEQSVSELIERFKRMIKEGNSQYFDSEEMEIIIEELIYSFEFDLSTRAIDYALALFPSNSSFRILKARKLRMEFEFEKAERELQEIEDSFPPTAEFYKEKFSLMSITNQNMEDTYKTLFKAYQLSPEDPEIHFSLAFEYVKRDEMYKAVKSVLFALRHDLEYGEQLPHFTFLFEEEKKFEEGLHFYKAITREFPLLKGGWFGLGIARSWLQQHNEAIEAFEFALSIDDQMGSALFNIANSYYELNQFANAIRYYQYALDMDPTDINSITAIGDCYHKLGEYENAILYYQQALKKDSEHQEAILGFAALLRENNRTKEAEMFIEKAFSLAPLSFDLLFAVVSHYDESVQKEKLQHFFELTLQQIEDKSSFFRHFTLFCCYNELYEFGIDLLLEYLNEYDSEHLFAYYIAALYFLSGEHAKGSQYLSDALLVNYKDYPYFLSIDSSFENLPEIINLIEIYKN